MYVWLPCWTAFIACFFFFFHFRAFNLAVALASLSCGGIGWEEVMERGREFHKADSATLKAKSREWQRKQTLCSDPYWCGERCNSGTLPLHHEPYDLSKSVNRTFSSGQSTLARSSASHREFLHGNRVFVVDG